MTEGPLFPPEPSGGPIGANPSFFDLVRRSRPETLPSTPGTSDVAAPHGTTVVALKFDECLAWHERATVGNEVLNPLPKTGEHLARIGPLQLHQGGGIDRVGARHLPARSFREFSGHTVNGLQLGFQKLSHLEGTDGAALMSVEDRPYVPVTQVA